jgi:hypothetical protein
VKKLGFGPVFGDGPFYPIDWSSCFAIEEPFVLVLPLYWFFGIEVFDVLGFMFMGGGSETINKKYCCRQGPNCSEYGWSCYKTKPP